MDKGSRRVEVTVRDTLRDDTAQHPKPEGSNTHTDTHIHVFLTEFVSLIDCWHEVSCQFLILRQRRKYLIDFLNNLECSAV